MASDGCFGFKRRITDIGDTEGTPPPKQQSSTTLLTMSQEDKEEQGIAENKNLSFPSDSKKAKCSSPCEPSLVSDEENQELGIASGAEQNPEVLDSLVSGLSGSECPVKTVEDLSEEVKKIENFEVGNICEGEGRQEKFDFMKGGVEDSVKESFLSAFTDKEEKALAIPEGGVEVVSATEANNEELLKEAESGSLLEVKKKQLLEELEAVLIADNKCHEEKVSDFDSSLKVEVIDQTALIEFNGHFAERKVNKIVNQEVDGKKARRSRRKAKKVFEMSGRPENVLVNGATGSGCRRYGDGIKKEYPRKEMEALRFANIVEQRKIWKEIYNGLGAAVAREYDDLASSKNQKHLRLNSDTRQRFAKDEEAPAILREACSESLDSDFETMQKNETENLSPLDPASCPSVGGGDGYTGFEEECSEDDDSEEDYATIQRPAFLVEGEPRFDSGPPEDGLEYLRRVRWEAAQIPKVKVAKFDRSKFNKEQSVYMPQIPDIANCPEPLLPLKQWEDALLADFSKLRLALSCLEGSSENLSGKLQSVLVIHENCYSNQLPQGIVHENFDVIEAVHSNQPDDCPGLMCTIGQPSSLTAEDHDNSLPSDHCSPKASAAESSGPLLSVISRMDSVARVSTLRKRISSLVTQNTLSRNDCMWLFALCAVVDTPLDADSCAALRTLLRKCATLRAAKSELDDEVIMLNIMATIAGRYFGQSGS